ncbi:MULTISPECIES: hypothetical protein [unclassified Rhodosalinus]|uniref:hypothetical protein n=1 Tax=unclassified Rhodosalinus TaxID=2630183 RepID=UPI003526606B
MKHDWILDVLADLKNFSRANGLPALAERLDDTRLLAMAEIASQSGRAPRGDRLTAGWHSETPGDGSRD